jgi:type VII secretion-associated serine protease mycosin
VAGAVRTAEESALHAIGVPAAWRLSRGKGVKVGVLDTGVGAGAPDLAGSVTSGPDYTIGVDPPGYRPPHLHGTYISSLIAGHGSGPSLARGVIGVAPAAKILSVRVLPDDQEPGLPVYNDSPRYGDAISRGIRYAVRHGVSVINMSLGSSSPDRGLRAAVAYAISHDVVVVAAAGNSGSGSSQFTPYSYPASYPGVIAVAAVSSQGSRAFFSDRNASVVVSAPGVSIVGAAPAGNYLQASGTSPASALVAGVATLIRSAYPRLPPALVAQALITSTRHRPQHGYSPNVGFGEVNAPAALQAARRLARQQPAAGAPPAARAVPGTPGPVQVVHRDAARIFGYGGISAAATLGFLAALVALAVLGRRALRDRGAHRAGSPGGAAGAPLPDHAPGPGPAPPGYGYPGPGPGYGYPAPPGHGYPAPDPGYGHPGTGYPGAGSPGPGSPGPGLGYGSPGAGHPGCGYPDPGPPARPPGDDAAP